MTIADIKSSSYTSYARNRKEADVFREAGIIEKYGSGIQRITKAFISYGLEEPVFEEFQNGFRVTVFNNTNTNINDASVNEGLNEGLNSMLTAIIQNPAIQAKQLSNILEDRPLKTIERQIKSLTDKGYIERKGSKKNRRLLCCKRLMMCQLVNKESKSK